MNGPQDLSAPLTRFFEELNAGLEAAGMPPSERADPRKRERMELLEYDRSELPVAALGSLTFAALRALVDRYGAALQLSFLFGDSELLTLDAGFDQGAFDAFLQAAQRLPAVTLDLRLDKRALLASWLPALLPGLSVTALPGIRPFLFLYPATLRRFLRRASLPDLELRLWSPDKLPAQADPAARVLLLLPDHDILLSGPLLVVVGGKELSRLPQLAAQPVDGQPPVAALFRAAGERLRWESPWLRFLTPEHLAVEPGEYETDPLAQALRVHLANAVLLFTADRTVQGQARLVSVFAGPTQSVSLRHADPDVAAAGSFPWQRVRRLLALFRWAYSTEWPAGERLELAQLVVVQALQAADAGDRYELLLANAGHLEAELRWNWQELLQNKVGAYHAQVQELEGVISAMVSAYAEQVNGIVRSLTETMLAAVGVTLASFVAALFGDSFNETIFRIGVLAYAGYVLLFPLLYNMSNQWGHYQALERDFSFRRARFAGRLHGERVDAVIGDEVERNRRRFLLWFWATVLLYLLVIVVALWAAGAVPALFPPGTAPVGPPTPVP